MEKFVKHGPRIFQGTEKAKREQERVSDWVRSDGVKERI